MPVINAEELAAATARIEEAKTHLTKAQALLAEVFNEFDKHGVEVVDLTNPAHVFAEQLCALETNTLFELAGVYTDHLERIVEDFTLQL